MFDARTDIAAMCLPTASSPGRLYSNHHFKCKIQHSLLQNPSFFTTKSINFTKSINLNRAPSFVVIHWRTVLLKTQATSQLITLKKCAGSLRKAMQLLYRFLETLSNENARSIEENEERRCQNP